MTQEAFKKNLTDSKYIQNWTTKAREVLKKNNMKIVVWGSPYDTVEQMVIGIETDASLDEFGKISTALYHIDPEFIDYAKTLIVHQD